MIYLQPPAGDRVRLGRASPGTLLPELEPGPGGVRYYASGTMALAAAVARALRQGGGTRTEVLIPAYTCPALVSAVIQAGGDPVLVDMRPGSLEMDTEAARRRVGGSTAAIVAVSLFGVPQPLESVVGIARESGALLIHDLAQGFPDFAAANGTLADFTIFSFGRGKQVSLLEGGALCSGKPGLLPGSRAGETSLMTDIRFLARALAYNLLRRPRLYYLMERLPGLALGETRYVPLQERVAMSEAARSRLAANVAALRGAVSPAQRTIAEVIRGNELPAITDLAGKQDVRLNRYPLLVKSRGSRDLLLRRLRASGVGASVLYGKALPQVHGIPAQVQRQGPFPAASDLADRLLTLPVHRGLSERDLERLRKALSDPF